MGIPSWVLDRRSTAKRTNPSAHRISQSTRRLGPAWLRSLKYALNTFGRSI
jgi:hypothetical protein